MESQRPTVNLAPPPPASPFAYRLSDEPFGDREMLAEYSFLSRSESSVLIQSSLSSANVESNLGSLNTLVDVPLTIEVVNEDGALFGLAGLHFVIKKDEDDDITFTNEAANGPLRITVSARKASGELSLHVCLNYVGLKARHAYACAQFLQALGRGGEFRILYKVPETETDVTFLRGSIPAGAYPGPPPHHMKALEQLVLIQEKTGAQFTIPEGGISPEDAQNSRVVARIVETGRITYQVSSWDATLRPEAVQSMLETFAEARPVPVVMDYPAERVMNVLGVEVELGPMLVGLTRVYMTPDDFEALRRSVETAEPGSIISARMTPYEDSLAESYYMRYLPVEHAAAIYRMVIFQQIERKRFLMNLLEASRQGETIVTARFAELIAALRKNVLPHEAVTANPVVTCSPEELLNTLSEMMHDLGQEARFALAALLFKHDVLSSGKASRFAGMDRVSFLMSLHKVGVPMIDFDEQELREQVDYANAE